MKLQLDELWKYAQSVAVSELDDTDPGGFDKIDKEKVEQTIAKIDAALKDKPVSKEVKQKLNHAKKNWPAALDKYEQQEKTIYHPLQHPPVHNRHPYFKRTPQRL